MKTEIKCDEVKNQTERMLRKHPDLWENGFGLPRLREDATHEERLVARRQSRDNMINGRDVETALEWIRKRCKKLKRINPRRTSYGLKHDMEKEDRKLYVRNGAFIVAALIEGYEIRKRGVNPCFNMSIRA